jgi:hypothetical protein
MEKCKKKIIISSSSSSSSSSRGGGSSPIGRRFLNPFFVLNVSHNVRRSGLQEKSIKTIRNFSSKTTFTRCCQMEMTAFELGGKSHPAIF